MLIITATPTDSPPTRETDERRLDPAPEVHDSLSRLEDASSLQDVTKFTSPQLTHRKRKQLSSINYDKISALQISCKVSAIINVMASHNDRLIGLGISVSDY